MAIPARNGAPGLQPQAGQETGFAESDGSGRFVASSTRLARLQERDRVALGTEWIRAGLKTTRQMSKGAAGVDFMQFFCDGYPPLGSSFWQLTAKGRSTPGDSDSATRVVRSFPVYGLTVAWPESKAGSGPTDLRCETACGAGFRRATFKNSAVGPGGRLHPASRRPLSTKRAAPFPVDGRLQPIRSKGFDPHTNLSDCTPAPGAVQLDIEQLVSRR